MLSFNQKSEQPPETISQYQGVEKYLSNTVYICLIYDLSLASSIWKQNTKW